jgi:hypothetical protein
MRQLGSVLNAEAYGINLSGQIVGASASGLYVPYVWDAKTGAVQNLGTLGKSEGVATAINSIGQVVGWIDTDLFIWTQAGGMRDLGHFGSGVTNSPAINDLGQVVGSYDLTTGGGSSFIWSQTTGMRDLKSLVDSSANGWSLGRPMSINDAGQIVGVGIDRSGFNEAFLLTPLPEPSTLILFAVGSTMGGAAVWRWRRNQTINKKRLGSVIFSPYRQWLHLPSSAGLDARRHIVLRTVDQRADRIPQFTTNRRP